LDSELLETVEVNKCSACRVNSIFVLMRVSIVNLVYSLDQTLWQITLVVLVSLKDLEQIRLHKLILLELFVQAHPHFLVGILIWETIKHLSNFGESVRKLFKVHFLWV